MAAGYSIYYVDEEGVHEFVESHSDPVVAYQVRDKLQAEVDEDPDAEGMRVVVRKEP
jgi:hypothetical protein